MSNIQSAMHENRVFSPATEFVQNANVSGMAGYQALCQEAEQDYTGFWGRLARETIEWKKTLHHGIG